jgi:methylated-DNA-[protein]-cysteine S-methyltransferase
MIQQYAMKSQIGMIYLVASAKGLQGVYLRKQSVPLITTLSSKEPTVKILALAAKELEEYFQGKRKSFKVPFDIIGTPFQKKVWNALSTIPYGKTVSYKDIAEKIKNKKAFRAVGTANGKNPLCIIVPCHRVIAADGTLGGYSGGYRSRSSFWL